jgi:fumarylpyruvate hydrolase
VGRNYADHAREMGGNPDREPPFFFQKNPDTIVPDGGTFPYPSRSSDVHHEFELVVAIGVGGREIAVGEALDHVFGYAVGLDMTRRDLQNEAKKAGRPWEVAKAFEHAAPCSAIAPASAIGHPAKGRIRLKVNGAIRQEGDIAQLVWSVPETVAHLSGLFELRPGDLIFTGTPAGVGPVRRGDLLEGEVEGVATLTVRVA